jgi:hypothetical protein
MAPRIVEIAVKKTGAVPNLFFADFALIDEPVYVASENMYKDAKKNQNRDFDIFVFVKNNEGKIVIAGLDPEQLADLLNASGIDRKYTRRLLYWVYRRAVCSFSEINDIPLKVINVLSDKFVTGLSGPASSVASADGSVKYLFHTPSGLPYEAVCLSAVRVPHGLPILCNRQEWMGRKPHSRRDRQPGHKHTSPVYSCCFDGNGGTG